MHHQELGSLLIGTPARILSARFSDLIEEDCSIKSIHMVHVVLSWANNRLICWSRPRTDNDMDHAIIADSCHWLENSMHINLVDVTPSTFTNIGSKNTHAKLLSIHHGIHGIHTSLIASLHRLPPYCVLRNFEAPLSYRVHTKRHVVYKLTCVQKLAKYAAVCMFLDLTLSHTITLSMWKHHEKKSQCKCANHMHRQRTKHSTKFGTWTLLQGWRWISKLNSVVNEHEYDQHAKWCWPKDLPRVTASVPRKHVYNYTSYKYSQGHDPRNCWHSLEVVYGASSTACFKAVVVSHEAHTSHCQ